MESLPTTFNLPSTFIEEMENSMYIIDQISIMAEIITQDKSTLDNLVSQVSAEHAKLTAVRDQVTELKHISLPYSPFLSNIKAYKEEINASIAALQKKLSELEEKKNVTWRLEPQCLKHWPHSEKKEN
ncbi:hypothetical protein Fmac_025364 [Flemingia macrophylla]|uniref:Biogenesis of lysosome-related organelles complex 1 subunit 7 n=1 Tax=Flemingia macrophylla TaxID=520843 RepID=A0ABD1LS03_9FABA